MTVSQSEVQQVHLLSEMMVCIVVVNPYVIVRPGSLHMNEKSLAFLQSIIFLYLLKCSMKKTS